MTTDVPPADDAGQEAGPRLPWEPSDPTRFAVLGLADPEPDGKLPAKPMIADVLIYALMLPGAPDPVEGILGGVRMELEVFSRMTADHKLADVLMMWARRIEAAAQLLRWTDNREKLPLISDEPEP